MWWVFHILSHTHTRDDKEFARCSQAGTLSRRDNLYRPDLVKAHMLLDCKKLDPSVSNDVTVTAHTLLYSPSARGALVASLVVWGCRTGCLCQLYSKTNRELLYALIQPRCPPCLQEVLQNLKEHIAGVFGFFFVLFRLLNLTHLTIW